MTFSGCCRSSFSTSIPRFPSRWWICKRSLILACNTSKNRNVSNFPSKSIKTHPRSLPSNGMLCKTFGNIAPTAVWISNSVFPLPPNPHASITCECFKDLCWSKKDKPVFRGSIFDLANMSAPFIRVASNRTKIRKEGEWWVSYTFSKSVCFVKCVKKRTITWWRE